MMAMLNKSLKSLHWFFACLSFGLMPVAWSMEVEDAEPLALGVCQLETWLHFKDDGTRRILTPACGVTDALELGVSGAAEKDAQGLFMSEAQIQAKYLIQGLSHERRMTSVMLGVGREVSPDERTHQMTYFAKLPMTFLFKSGDVKLLTEIGIKHAHSDRDTVVTWGLGNETLILPRLSFIGEVYGESVKRPLFQAGIKAHLIPEKLELELSYGNRLGLMDDARFVLLGLRFISPTWF
jgi:hypothetical protein